MAEEEEFGPDTFGGIHRDALVELLPPSAGAPAAALGSLQACWLRYGGRRFWATLRFVGGALWTRPGLPTQAAIDVVGELHHRKSLVPGTGFELLVGEAPRKRSRGEPPRLVARGTVTKVRQPGSK
jgi:hypothetical protein